MRGDSSIGGAVTLPRLFGSDDQFPPHISGWEIDFHACLDSTNLEGNRLISQGLNEKRLIIAETQTNGQCRHDRLWESPPGKGLWVSFILPVSVSLDILPQSTLTLAVAVRNGIREATGIPLLAKWPNDLLADGRKCCGLLVEISIPPRGGPIPLIMGVGVNCSHVETDFPPHLRETATSLSLLANGAVFSRGALLAHIAQSVDNWFNIWKLQGFTPIRQAWIDGNCTLGKAFLLPDGYGHVRGKALDIDESGALIVLSDDGSEIRVDSGEILSA